MIRLIILIQQAGNAVSAIRNAKLARAKRTIANFAGRKENTKVNASMNVRLGVTHHQTAQPSAPHVHLAANAALIAPIAVNVSRDSTKSIKNA
jgi:hypothetical protein